MRFGKSRNQEKAEDKRRSIIHDNAKKEHLHVRNKKANLKRQMGSHIFDEIKYEKSYGPLKHLKQGLQIAPIILWKLWFITFSYRTIRISLEYPPLFEAAVLSIFGFDFILRKWTTRSKVKPKWAIGSYLIQVR